MWQLHCCCNKLQTGEIKFNTTDRTQRDVIQIKASAGHSLLASFIPYLGHRSTKHGFCLSPCPKPSKVTEHCRKEPRTELRSFLENCTYFFPKLCGDKSVLLFNNYYMELKIHGYCPLFISQNSPGNETLLVDSVFFSSLCLSPVKGFKVIYS